MPNLSVRGQIFNVQGYCIHDGPGIRSTVFVKGCPLACRWCQNPESQSAAPQLMFYSDKCRSCGMCAHCPSHAVTWIPGQKSLTDRAKCITCGACVKACSAKAREITGKTVSVSEVLEQVLSDKLFFDGSGGGMTVSGGEPLMQPEFTSNLLAAAQEAGVHTAVESCNFASRTVVDRVYAHVDLALCDIKHMDSAVHKRITGVPNEQILENIVYIRRILNKPMEIRTPVVPGYTGDLDNIAATAKFIAVQLGTDVSYALLPYHRLGESKGESLDRADCHLSATPPDNKYMARCQETAERYGLTVRIGG